MAKRGLKAHKAPRKFIPRTSDGVAPPSSSGSGLRFALLPFAGIEQRQFQL